jgi:hypothetical protein
MSGSERDFYGGNYCVGGNEGEDLRYERFGRKRTSRASSI